MGLVEVLVAAVAVSVAGSGALSAAAVALPMAATATTEEQALVITLACAEHCRQTAHARQYQPRRPRRLGDRLRPVGPCRRVLEAATAVRVPAGEWGWGGMAVPGRR